MLATHFVGASRQVNWGAGFGPYYPYGPYGGFGVGWRRRYWGYGDWGYGAWAYGPGYVDVERRADYQTDVFGVDAAGPMATQNSSKYNDGKLWRWRATCKCTE